MTVKISTLYIFFESTGPSKVNFIIKFPNAFLEILLFYEPDLSVFESTAQLLESNYSGSYDARGLFDERIEAKAFWNNTEFRGQYCTVFFCSKKVLPEELEENNLAMDENKRKNWMSILQFLPWAYNSPILKEPKARDVDYYSRYLATMDYCIPSSCSAEDFRSSIAQLVGSRTMGNSTNDGVIYYDSKVTLTDERYCYAQEKIEAAPNFDGPDIAVMYHIISYFINFIHKA